jgi:hypothetical protein
MVQLRDLPWAMRLTRTDKPWRADSKAPRPVIRLHHGRRVARFPSTDAVRKARFDPKAVVKAITTGRAYRGTRWAYEEAS